jgi:enolase
VLGLDASEQAFLDKTLIDLDGTDNKSRLGANAMLAVSMAVARAAAEESGLPLYRYFGGMGGMSLPVPMMNVVNGGAHANNNLDLQELMIIPVGAPSFREALRYGAEVFHALKKILHDKGMSTAVGDEGGFAPNVASHEAALQLILEAISARRATPPASRSRWAWTAPPASSTRTASTTWKAEGLQLAAAEWTDILATWVDKYPIISIEDGMAEGDWDGWKLLTDRLGKKVQLVGDDLFVTNTKILERRHRQGHGQLHPDQDQPDRHADRNLRRHRDGQARGLHQRHQPPLAARPKTAPSPTSPWAPTPARSRPVRSAAATAWPSTTSCCASRKTWATSPATPAAPPSTTCE